jgi:hypothetical protein
VLAQVYLLTIERDSRSPTVLKYVICAGWTNYHRSGIGAREVISLVSAVERRPATPVQANSLAAVSAFILEWCAL